jgi:hypothetical protein
MAGDELLHAICSTEHITAADGVAYADRGSAAAADHWWHGSPFQRHQGFAAEVVAFLSEER